MIALIDHGVGNLRSVEKALAASGAPVVLTADPGQILAAEKVVLPGVGAFADAMRGLQTRGLEAPIRDLVARGTPLLGICVGMQMLFEYSAEHGQHPGLGLLPGQVVHFPAEQTTTQGLKVPQTGWNQLTPMQETPLLRDLPSGSYAYFNHSYYCQPAEPTDILATTDYGFDYASVVGRGRLYGVQFHPEKSQQVGLTILRNFVQAG